MAGGTIFISPMSGIHGDYGEGFGVATIGRGVLEGEWKKSNFLWAAPSAQSFVTVNHPHQPSDHVGSLSNGGRRRYLIEAVSTTDFTAWQLDDGTTLISKTLNISLPPSPRMFFWSCAAFNNTTPAGDIIALDCHDNGLTNLDVTSLQGLKFLDCSFNCLTVLELTGLPELVALNADNNQLTQLNIGNLRSLRVLNCANNQIESLDTEVLDRLEVKDISGNLLKIKSVKQANPNP